MSTSGNELFYARLPINAIPLSELLMESHLFYSVPENWHIIITDVKNSTQAALDGRHQTVNLVATGSIVAALNVAYKDNILIPFFFGGDGATFIIPPNLLSSTLAALHQHRENSLTNFQLDLRVGHVPVQEIYKDERTLKISKLKTSDLFNIPVILGDGLNHAERIIKGKEIGYPEASGNDQELDMSGMHCRWDKIKPPSNGNEVISLLVSARNMDMQSQAFRKVMEAIDRIYGSQEVRKPISINRLRMVSSFKRINAEMRVRMGGFKLFYLTRTWLTTLIGKLYFRTKKGKEYLYKLVDMSDTLVIDGRINTVITGSAAQREELTTLLENLERDGEIFFGLHISTASVMSCYVRNLEEQHVHFIDGADGGYTKAAGVLKKKIAGLIPV
ncbi:MAG: DUF3095 domain-containing protein [Bacteroidetes bacterium]|nr:DUF3095 domain-containing protein [Bacteroidota bacterium]